MDNFLSDNIRQPTWQPCCPSRRGMQNPPLPNQAYLYNPQPHIGQGISGNLGPLASKMLFRLAPQTGSQTRKTTGTSPGIYAWLTRPPSDIAGSVAPTTQTQISPSLQCTRRWAPPPVPGHRVPFTGLYPTHRETEVPRGAGGRYMKWP